MITVDDFTRINNDVNGNPRYVFHFLYLISNKEMWKDGLYFPPSYELALKRAKQIGGKKFHNKQYGGGIVIQSYNLHDEVKRINEIISNLDN